MTELSDYCIVISPIGEFNREFLEKVGAEILKVFTCRTDIIPILEDIEFARDLKRGQYHSTVILEKLSALAPPHALKILAFTRMDLFIPILTHVYGEAQLGGKSSIISTHRLGEGIMGKEDTYLERVIKEAIHELGHTFNLLHCKDHHCIMHYCRDIKDVDRKTNQLCRYCRILLQDDLRRLRES